MMQEIQQSQRDPLLKVENLVVEYAVGGKTVHAVSDVSLQVARGETLGLVGNPAAASPLWAARCCSCAGLSPGGFCSMARTSPLHGDALRRMRRRMQLIFQDPIASLNPRRRIGDIIAEPLVISGVKDPEKAARARLRGTQRGRARSVSGDRAAAA
jgi:ATPase components of various ABC-type transport systems, contain duplicated ATPase